MRFFYASLIIFLSLSCEQSKTPVTLPEPADSNYFIRGLDLSFTTEMLQHGVKYKDGSVVKNLLELAREKGINTIRLRLWNNPADGHSALAEVAVFAQQVKSSGLNFWLDFHYSDTWADPGQQAKPAAWKNLTYSALKDSVYAFTTNTLQYLSDAGASPDFVETGNEINNGFLWNDGKLYDNGITRWQQFTELLQAATEGVRDAAPDAKIIVHYAGYEGAEAFYDSLDNYTSDFDIIGLSYYAWWHGKSINTLQQAMETLTTRYHKPVMIAETAYPFTLGWNDNTHNITGTQDQLINGYTATPEGQEKYMQDLIAAMKASCTMDFAGVCYWAPDWVAIPTDPTYSGCAWENLALFDFSYNALPALDVLGKE